MDPRAKKRTVRYLDQEQRRASEAISQLNMGGWFDLWHTHLDWRSKAGKLKGPVARRILKLLREAERRAQTRNSPIQVWASLCEDTGNSAVYLHTENPNGTPFPFNLGDVQWLTAAPPDLHGIVDSGHQVGVMRNDNEVVYLVRAKAQLCAAGDVKNARA